MSTPRIPPIDPPYSDVVSDAFSKIMPPGLPPLKIFRTFAHHPALLRKQMSLGALLLSHGSLPPRDREIVLLRTCALCGSEYEWGVHGAAYGKAVGLSPAQIEATVAGEPTTQCWSDRDRLLLRIADELHVTSTLSDETWAAVSAEWSKEQILELLAVAGMYHAVSYMTNACGVELEETAPRFPMEIRQAEPSLSH